MSGAPESRPTTGILLLNKGGPATLDAVEPFLHRIFVDRDIIRLPFQRWLGPWLARRRAPAVRARYASIGGGSPVLAWTEKQARATEARLDLLRPASAPHRAYVAFRYESPTADEALRTMARDGIEQVVALSLYPQWSCATAGSSFIDLGAALGRTGLGERFSWSFVDRWPSHPSFIAAVGERIREGLARYPVATRDNVLLLFSAHSVPRAVADRGDSYPHEVATTVALAMEHLKLPNQHELAWQSEVGPVSWVGPSTRESVRSLGAAGRKDVMVIPIAFTCDHLGTLSELDRDYANLAHSLGMTGYSRAPSLNDLPAFTNALATIVAEHLERGEPWSREYRRKCNGCTNSNCRPAFEGMGERPAA